ncbi:MAG: lipopolysaccharide heptosyltransferase II, partial [Planctomycetales bacterium]
MNIAVFLPNWIGDAAMATPLLRALRNHHGPDARMVGVMRPLAADLLAGTPWLDDHIYFHPGSWDRSLHSWNVLRQLRAERLDAVVLAPNSLRGGILA